MTHCLLLGATEYKVRKNFPMLAIISHVHMLKKLGQCLPNNNLPVRTWEEMREELLRVCHVWARVCAMKQIEAGLRQTSIEIYDLPIIRFQPLE